MDSIREAAGHPAAVAPIIMRARVGYLGAGVAVLLLSACGSPQSGAGGPQSNGSPTCTMEARSSFAVTVIDSLSGANLAPTATVRVAPAARPDSIVDLMATGGVYSGALYEQAGRFELSVTRPGYALWRMTGIEVGRDECHVITRVLTARLRPTG